MSDTKRLHTLLSIEESHAKLQTENFALNKRIAELEVKLKVETKAAGHWMEEANYEHNKNVKLEADNERLTSAVCANQTIQDAERLEWAKNNPRQFYEICQETLMSNVDEDVAIDAAMEGE